jgi:pilus assembly protein CpaB
MGTARIIVLVVAALAAIGLALVVRNMAGHRSAPPVVVAAAKPSVQVLVAKRDLSIGTRLAQGDVGWQSWPSDSLNPAWITDGAAPATPPASVAGRIGQGAVQAATSAASAVTGGPAALQNILGDVVREPILSGEPLVEGKLVKGGAGGYMAVVLQPGMRAVATPVTVETGAGGFILPGDRVDVVMSRKNDGAAVQGGGPPGSAQTILHNLKVLAIDQKVKSEKADKSIVGTVATLEVPAPDVELLLKSKAQGELALILRSYADVGGPSGAVQAGLGPGTAVRIIRNGHVSEVATR